MIVSLIRKHVFMSIDKSFGFKILSFFEKQLIERMIRLMILIFSQAPNKTTKVACG